MTVDGGGFGDWGSGSQQQDVGVGGSSLFAPSYDGLSDAYFKAAAEARAGSTNRAVAATASGGSGIATRPDDEGVDLAGRAALMARLRGVQGYDAPREEAYDSVGAGSSAGDGEAGASHGSGALDGADVDSAVGVTPVLHGAITSLAQYVSCATGCHWSLSVDAWRHVCQYAVTDSAWLLAVCAG